MVLCQGTCIYSKALKKTLISPIARASTTVKSWSLGLLVYNHRVKSRVRQWVKAYRYDLASKKSAANIYICLWRGVKQCKQGWQHPELHLSSIKTHSASSNPATVWRTSTCPLTTTGLSHSPPLNLLPLATNVLTLPTSLGEKKESSGPGGPRERKSEAAWRPASVPWTLALPERLWGTVDKREEMEF